MSEVSAIKDIETIKLVSLLLKKRYGQQMADVWDLGLNLALRISDLLSIQFSQISANRLTLKEGKTGKQATILLNPKAMDVINRIRLDNPYHLYVFQSHRSRYSINKTPRPLTRRAVSKAFKEIGDELRLSLGTHSMRKTRGFHLYNATNDITVV